MKTRDLTVEQAAEILGLSPGRVRQICQDGRLGTKHGRDWLITRKEVAAFKKLDRPAHRPAK
jgi:excisionase family DNA binding protein